MTTHTMPSPVLPALTRPLGVAGTAALRFVEFVRAYRRRRDLETLAALDDRMLRDIGLTRGDLRDAVAEPLWRDPTNVLVKRAGERRVARPARGPERQAETADAPPLAPAEDWSSYSLPARSRYY